MKRLLLTAAFALVLSAGAGRAAEPLTPVVVELFTSQGCYSCPPADAYLGELAAEPGVIAIGYHVNYWDRLGWPDPFATDWGTKRQYQYANAHGTRRVYTPQMMIDGAADAVGSDRRKVGALIRSARAAEKPAQPRLSWAGEGHLAIALPDAPNAAGAEIWLIRFDERRMTHILRGENGGKRLAYHHVARERQLLGQYEGRAQTIEATLRPSDSDWGVAVLVQSRGPGRIWGAATLPAD